MHLVVHSFEGACLGSTDQVLTMANMVRRSLHHHRAAIVVSSLRIGGAEEPTVSTRLLRAGVKVAGVPQNLLGRRKPNIASQSYLGVISTIEREHLAIVRGAVRDPVLGNEVEEDILRSCAELREFLGAVSVSRELTTRMANAIVATATLLGCRVFCAVLKSVGVECALVDLTSAFELTPTMPTTSSSDSLSSSISSEEDCAVDESSAAFAHLRERLVSTIPQLRGDGSGPIPVITGFMGQIPTSDAIGLHHRTITAALVAQTFSAHSIHFWQPRTGIPFLTHTYRPKRPLLPPQSIPTLTTSEVFELCNPSCDDDRSIHSLAVEIASDARIPLWVRDGLDARAIANGAEGAWMDRDWGGTVVVPDGVVVSRSAHGVVIGDAEGRERDRDREIYGIRAVTVRNGLCVVVARSDARAVPAAVFAGRVGVALAGRCRVEVVSMLNGKVGAAVAPLPEEEVLWEEWDDGKEMPHGLRKALGEVGRLTKVPVEIRARRSKVGFVFGKVGEGSVTEMVETVLEVLKAGEVQVDMMNLTVGADDVRTLSVVVPTECVDEGLLDRFQTMMAVHSEQ
ncbi:Aspartate/glutamate/uridylate kinase [Cladochytrium replicatum]|nr:Aspartate/glutamate/uridylate kinase [Cladochytrium replicatum]